MVQGLFEFPTNTLRSYLRPRSKGLLARLIDEEQTTGFGTFLDKMLRAAPAEAQAILKQFERKHAKATSMVDGFTRDAALLQGKDGIFAIGRTYPPEVLSAIRSGAPLPVGFGELIVSQILQVASAMMSGIFQGNKPSLDGALYSFPFRYTVAMYCMNLHWTAKGDVTTARPEKVRNDATDMTYAAFATFFDGVITTDNKLTDVYMLARGLLRNVFHV